jgi:hypothetical protein
VSFTVEPLPEVLQVVDETCTPPQKTFFDEQILSILREYPYEFLDVIQEHISGDGRSFYTYYDGIVPLVFTYRVFPPKDDWTPGAAGYVPIIKADQPWW